MESVDVMKPCFVKLVRMSSKDLQMNMYASSKNPFKSNSPSDLTNQVDTGQSAAQVTGHTLEKNDPGENKPQLNLIKKRPAMKPSWERIPFRVGLPKPKKSINLSRTPKSNVVGDLSEDPTQNRSALLKIDHTSDIHFNVSNIETGCELDVILQPILKHVESNLERHNVSETTVVPTSSFEATKFSQPVIKIEKLDSFVNAVDAPINEFRDDVNITKKSHRSLKRLKNYSAIENGRETLKRPRKDAVVENVLGRSNYANTPTQIFSKVSEHKTFEFAPLVETGRNTNTHHITLLATDHTQSAGAIDEIKCEPTDQTKSVIMKNKISETVNESFNLASHSAEDLQIGDSQYVFKRVCRVLLNRSEVSQYFEEQARRSRCHNLKTENNNSYLKVVQVKTLNSSYEDSSLRSVSVQEISKKNETQEIKHVKSSAQQIVEEALRCAPLTSKQSEIFKSNIVDITVHPRDSNTEASTFHLVTPTKDYNSKSQKARQQSNDFSYTNLNELNTNDATSDNRSVINLSVFQNNNNEHRLDFSDRDNLQQNLLQDNSQLSYPSVRSPSTMLDKQTFFCMRCGLYFDLINAFQKHLILVHEIHKCCRCNLNILNVACVDLHMKFCTEESNDQSNDGTDISVQINDRPELSAMELTKPSNVLPSLLLSLTRCVICGASLPDMESLSKHKLDYHSFACNHCTFVTSTLEQLHKHRVYHHRYYLCTPCNTDFPDFSALLQHSKEKQHLGGTFSCLLCKLTFCDLKYVLRHNAVKHNKGYFCLKCLEVFADLTLMYTHYEKCTHKKKNVIELADTNFEIIPGKNFKCDMCRTKLASEINLRIHKAIHHKTESYCIYCKVFFNESSEMHSQEFCKAVSLLRKHGELVFHCIPCKLIFPTWLAKQLHRCSPLFYNLSKTAEQQQQNSAPQLTMPAEVSSQFTIPEEVSSQFTIPEEVSSQFTIPEEVSSQFTIPEEVSSQFTISEELQAICKFCNEEFINNKELMLHVKACWKNPKWNQYDSTFEAPQKFAEVTLETFSESDENDSITDSHQNEVYTDPASFCSVEMPKSNESSVSKTQTHSVYNCDSKITKGLSYFRCPHCLKLYKSSSGLCKHLQLPSGTNASRHMVVFTKRELEALVTFCEHQRIPLQLPRPDAQYNSMPLLVCNYCSFKTFFECSMIPHTKKCLANQFHVNNECVTDSYDSQVQKFSVTNQSPETSIDEMTQSTEGSSNVSILNVETLNVVNALDEAVLNAETLNAGKALVKLH